MSARALKEVCDRLNLTGDDVDQLLGTYADFVEETEPQAEHEIELARIIGLNIKDILEEMSA